jgi:hypothetical protein
MLRLAALVLLAVLSACDAPASFAVQLSEARPVLVPARAYYSLAWLASDTIALSYGDQEPAVVLVNTTGNVKGQVEIDARPECGYRLFLTLARLPSGELSLTDVCGVGGPEVEVNDFLAVDLESGHVRSLGRASQPPHYVTWKDDSTAVYAAGDHLCTTLYVHADREVPLDVEVSVAGQRFKVGQDLDLAPGGCPAVGRAGHPTYSPDGRTLAFMASPNDMTVGQGRLHLPWTMLVTDDHGPATSVLGGVRHPGDMLWLLDGSTLVFSGEVGGRQGVWQVKSDGSELTLLSEILTTHMALAPDGSAVVALRESESADLDVLILELP